jgi:hypothetical protein
MPPSDIVSANMSATTNKVMRFLIFSHLLSFFPKEQDKPTATSFGGRSRLRRWLCSPLS